MPYAYTDLQQEWRSNHQLLKTAYTDKKSSFVPNLLPEIAVSLDPLSVFDLLQKRLGSELLQRAIDPTQSIASPLAGQPDSSWLKKSKMVGINVRTIDNFFNVVKYVLTIPDHFDSVHLLPIWEPGVVGSLYGMISWNINPEFYSEELGRLIPALDTPEKQLKITINLLHALGKSVGMDVIPHNDRFSEMVLAYPRYFEWVRRLGGQIVNQSESIYREIEEIIWLYLHRKGTADGSPLSFSRNTFFAPEIPILSDEKRHEILFGKKDDREKRLNRRIELIHECLNHGYETLPMTMAPPYRSLHINPESFVLDDYGYRWYDYEFDAPEKMSRVFGPLVRYKFYHSKNDNQHWELDFENPQKPVWEYICKKYEQIQTMYGFDFMRGDMAHVQPRPDGVPAELDDFYDPLRAIKRHVQKKVPYFGFFAETFLAPPDTMGYGDEYAHLEAIEADSTLGDLQSAVVGGEVFNERFAEYYKLLKTKKFAPNFTVMTADKDDPRFDEFYRTANVFRYFVATFLDMPTYVGLGFESRNLHLERGKNEEYTKLYVFQIRDDSETDKVTHAPYIWGKNEAQFAEILKIRSLADQLPELRQAEVQWLTSPEDPCLIWQRAEYVFVANRQPEGKETHFDNIKHYDLVYDTSAYAAEHLCQVYKKRA